MEKKRRGRPKKQPDFTKGADITKWIGDMVKDDAKTPEKMNTEASVKSFVDSMMATAEKKKSNRQLAREKSKGATGGLLKAMDPTIQRVTAMALANNADIVKLKRSNEENTQTIRRLSNSVSALESRISELTDQSNKTLGLLGDLLQNFNMFKKDVEKKFKKIQPEKSGGVLDTALDALDTLGSAKSSSTKTATKVTPKTGPTSVFKSIGSLGKTAAAKIPMIGGLVEGVTEYVQGGDLGRSISVAAGNVLGGIIGGAAGTILGGPVGTFVGGVGGAMAGAELAKSGYDWLFGASGPKESKAVKQAREQQENLKDAEKTAGSQAGSNKVDKVGTAGGTAGSVGGGDLDTSNLKGVGETGSASQAMNILTSKGWTQEQAAGIVGNLQMESGPDMKTNAVGDGGKAYGIAQWHPDRQQHFKQQFNKDIREAGFIEQLEFVDWELRNKELTAFKALKEAKSAREAAIVFDKFYERSSGAHRAQRVANAEAIMKTRQGGDAKMNTEASSPTMAPEGTYTVPTTEKGVAAPGTPALANPKAGEGKDASAGYKPSPGEGNLKFAPGVDQNINSGIARKVSEIQSGISGLTITSGFRDQKRNAKHGGAKDSAHTRGNAVDLTFAGGEQQTIRVIEAASKAGIGGIGVYKPGHIHIDTESRRIWGPDYTPNSIRQVPWAAGILNAHVSGTMGQYDATAASRPRISEREGNGNRSRSEGIQLGQIQAVRGMSAIGTGRGSTIPSAMGAVTTIPGMGNASGLLSTLAVGAARNMVPQNPMAMVGLVGSMLNMFNQQMKQTDVRAPNPAFTPDRYQNNSVPSALPPGNVLREVFGMEVETAYRP